MCEKAYACVIVIIYMYSKLNLNILISVCRLFPSICKLFSLSYDKMSVKNKNGKKLFHKHNKESLKILPSYIRIA